MAFSIDWDATGNRTYEVGVDRGVLYVASDDEDAHNGYGDAVAWNGLTSVSENPTGAESEPLYADNDKYLNLVSAEDFEATIEAYTYPPEFEACNGFALLGEQTDGGDSTDGVYISQQARKKFAMSYRTNVGTDLNDEAGYKIHLVYGCSASPSEKSYETINDSPEAITFSWDMTTVSIEQSKMPGNMQPCAHVTINTHKLKENATYYANLPALEQALYGDGSNPGYMPTPAEVFRILTTGA